MRFAEDYEFCAVPGVAHGADRAVLESSAWDSLSSASYHQHLPPDIMRRHTSICRRSGRSRASAVQWPALQEGERNVLLVTLINQTSMPAFRAHAAVVRKSDGEEMHAVHLGSALVQNDSTSFLELSRLGRRSKASLNHDVKVMHAEAALADARGAHARATGSVDLDGAGAMPSAGTAIAMARRGSSASLRVSLDESSSKQTRAVDTGSLVADAERTLRTLRDSAPLELTAEELAAGYAEAFAVHKQACALMKCAHDAITNYGLLRAVRMFESGLELQASLDGDVYTVLGQDRRPSCLGACFGSRVVAWAYTPPGYAPDRG